MQKLFSLGPKEILSGMSNGEHMSNGIFSEMEQINLFTHPDRYGSLAPTYRIIQRGGPVNSKIKFVVEYNDPNWGGRDPSFYAYGEDGELFNLHKSVHPDFVSEIDSSNKGERQGASGLIVYNGDLYVFSRNDIGLYDFGTETIDNDWGSTQHKSLNEWRSTNNSWHTPYIYNGTMYFGNGNYIGFYNTSTLNTEFFQLPFGYNAVDMAEYNGLLAILCIDLNRASSIIVLWDGFSSFANYVYNKSGLYYALDNFKNELVLGGSDIVLFRGGNYQPLYVNKNDSIEAPHQMQSREGVLYWADGNIVMAYGSKVVATSDAFYSPYKASFTMSTFYIGMNYALVFDTELLTNDFSLLVYDYSNKDGATGEATTVNFDVGNAIIKKVGIACTGVYQYISENPDEFICKITVIPDNYHDAYVGNNNKRVVLDFVGETSVGRTYLEKQLITSPVKFLKLKVDLKRVYINRIDIYGEQTDRTN